VLNPASSVCHEAVTVTSILAHTCTKPDAPQS
jgi:hypothetical protein